MLPVDDKGVPEAKIKQIVVLGLAVTLAAFFFGQRQAALGLAVGTPLGVLNYLLVQGSIRPRPHLSPRKAQNVFMGRALLRLLISLAAMVLALPFGIPFFLGITGGLILHMLTYFYDLILLLCRKG